MKSAKILVIEDDPDGLRSVRDALEDAGYAVVAAQDGRSGVARFGEGDCDVVLSDLVLPDISGLDVLEQIRRIGPETPVLIMTAYGSVDTAVRALKSGAYDYLVKPLNLDDVQGKVARAVETVRLRSRVQALQAEVSRQYALAAVTAASQGMQEVVRQVRRLAGTTATVLVCGESGTGKELVARALHAESRRSAGPFVAVSCGAFAETVLESELFGHEKGAFTGATQLHRGAFERADGGTLFLDEIGLAPRAVQSRLLRVLETKEVLRVGGAAPIALDVRIVSATNRDLKQMAADGEFLPDLLYRLQVVTIRIPPLRERREDIRPLADRFVASSCAEHGRRILGVEPGFYEALEDFEWPGNVRQLRNAVEAAVVMASGDTLTRGDVRLSEAPPPADAAQASAALTLADLERDALLRTLQRNDGNRVLSARDLGISVRTIQRKIKEYSLPF